MKIVMFVSNSASTANKPEESTTVLRLNLPPKSDKVDDANADVFTDEQRKSALIELQGISEELRAIFKGGQRVTVTIEPAAK